MIWNRIVASTFFLIVLHPLARAQDPAPICGLAWMDMTTGTQVGPDCSRFSCTPFSTVTSAGRRVITFVAGTYVAPYAIMLSGSATQCVTIPGIANSLTLMPPAWVVFTGRLGIPSRLLSCPTPFSSPYHFTFPTGVPVGSTFAIQAVTLGTRARAFSRAIHVTVR